MPPALLIKSTQPGGHFRAGRHHGPEETAWDIAGFTPAELDTLRGDPRLIITEGEIEVPVQIKPVPKLAAHPVAAPPLPPPFPVVTDPQDALTAAAPEGATPPAPAPASDKPAKTPAKGKKAKA